MTLNEALDIFECISNLETERLMSYYAKHYLSIQKAAEIASRVIRDRQALDKLLRCWQIHEGGD